MREIGTVYYRVETHYNHITRKRLQFTDAEGNIWHRYDKDPISFSIKEYKLVGILEKKLIGDVSVGDLLTVDNLENVYILVSLASDEDGMTEEWYDSEFDDTVFESRGYAERFLAECEEKNRAEV